MLFGPDQQIAKRIKKCAINAEAIDENVMDRAMQVSKALREINETQTTKISRERKKRMETVEIEDKKAEAKKEATEAGVEIGENFFTLGKAAILRMVRLETFTKRELAAELDVSLGIAGQWIQRAMELNLIEEGESRFGEQAYMLDQEGFRKTVEEIKSGLNYLLEEVS